MTPPPDDVWTARVRPTLERYAEPLLARSRHATRQAAADDPGRRTRGEVRRHARQLAGRGPATARVARAGAQNLDADGAVAAGELEGRAPARHARHARALRGAAALDHAARARTTVAGLAGEFHRGSDGFQLLADRLGAFAREAVRAAGGGGAGAERVARPAATRTARKHDRGALRRRPRLAAQARARVATGRRDAGAADASAHAVQARLAAAADRRTPGRADAGPAGADPGCGRARAVLGRGGGATPRGRDRTPRRGDPRVVGE